MRILTIGGATKDIFIAYSQAQMFNLRLHEGRRSFLIFEDGKKVEVEGLEYHTGGGATNTAVGFRRLGHEVSSFFKIGHDQEGVYVIQSLHVNEVNTSHAIETNELPTATSFIIPTIEGNRIVLVYRGANLTLKEEEIPNKAIQEAELVYITSLSGNASLLLLPIVERAKKYKKMVVVNPGTSQLTVGTRTLWQSLKYIDILILNTYEACCCMKSLVKEDPELQIKMIKMHEENEIQHMPDLLQTPLDYEGLNFGLRTFFREVHARGPHTVVVTNGKGGVYVSNNGTIFFHPSLSVPVISTLGAGDAFGSGFVGMLADDYSLEDSIRAGMLNSASVVGAIGAKTGLLYKNEMDKRLHAIVKGLLQKYQLEDKNK
jgi:sugar/nucleoside kinase (ribokinase family)